MRFIHNTNPDLIKTTLKCLIGIPLLGDISLVTNIYLEFGYEAMEKSL